ncbi:AAA family ATPase [Exiguobacterium sp. s127]|uniref:AAA family ATPase n=1 Tax=Exiguobacterium sp. s127 TaxID=2751210 RepID=UPI001BE7FE4D|nr:AAA family ATPase [Exiguobacterium sp. s127]
MEKELIYLYMSNINNIFIEQGVNFSMDYNVIYNPKNNKLNIIKKNNEIKFIENNVVSNINLIIGKNGSGKSTIVNILGMNEIDKLNYLKESPSNKWFTIYRLNNNQFIVEGNHNYIPRVQISPSQKEDKYRYAEFNINKKGEVIFSTHRTEEEQLQSLNYFYYINSHSEEWFSTYNMDLLNNIDNGFRRNYITSPNMADIFNLLSDDSIYKEEDFLAKNVQMRVSRISLIDKSDDQKSEFIFSKLKSIQGITEEYNSLLNYKKNFNEKQKFIISFFEEVLSYELESNKEASELISENKKFTNTYNKLINEDINFQIIKEWYLNLLGDHTFQVMRKKPNFEYHRYKKIINLLDNINEEYFQSDEIIYELRESTNVESVRKLVHELDELKNQKDNFPLEIRFKHLSSGELQYLKHFSTIITTLKSIKDKPRIKHIILLLDEPDMNFHPEWSRRYINNLMNTLNKHVEGFTVQVIITSHSPFMASDLPKESIMCIDINSSNNQRIITEANFGLMSNHYDLIKNTFFMDNSIGEYANNYFNGIVNTVKFITNEINQFNNSNDLREGEKREKVTYILDSIEEVRKKINLIDDTIIQRKITNYLNNNTIRTFTDNQSAINELREWHLRELNNTGDQSELRELYLKELKKLEEEL